MANATTNEILAEMDKVWDSLALAGAGKPDRILVHRKFYDAAMQENPEVFAGLIVEIMEPING